MQQQHGGQPCAVFADGAVPQHGALLGVQHVVEEGGEAALAGLVQHHALVDIPHDLGWVILHGAQHL